jgi:hypothetical protein
MVFLQKLKSMFKKQEPVKISDLKIGDVVELSYHHPKDLGFFNENQLTCTRLNPDELENRKIKGIIISVYRNQEIYRWFLEVKTHKTYDSIPVERCFLFMENEIETIRKLK